MIIETRYDIGNFVYGINLSGADVYGKITDIQTAIRGSGQSVKYWLDDGGSAIVENRAFATDDERRLWRKEQEKREGK